MRFIRISSLFILIALLIFPACQRAGNEGTENIYTQSAFMMDTLVEIQVASADSDLAQKAVSAALARMREIDRDMNRFDPKSILGRVNQQAGIKPVAVPPDLFAILERGREWGKISNGAFDLTVGAISRLWDFVQQKKPDEQTTQANLPLVNYQLLQLDKSTNSAFLSQKGMVIDLGGNAKGYAVDEAVRILKDHGIRQALVNAGGNMRALGGKGKNKPWKIGVQHPRKANEVIATIPLSDQAVSTSGDYERYFIQNGVRYHHIFDPKSGQSAQGMISVTIIAESAEAADVLSTAVFVLGADRGLKLVAGQPSTYALLVIAEGKVVSSPGFPLTEVKF